MNIDDFFTFSPLFASLNEEAKKQLFPKFSRVDLVAHEILFYQGAPSDSVYFLVSGKLAAELTTRTGERRVVGQVEVGEMVGELGAFSNEPRTLTVKALKESVLLKMTTPDFVTLCQQYPAVMFAALQPIMARTSGLIQMLATEKQNKHIVIVPANHQVSIKLLAEKLVELADKFPSTLVVTDEQEEFRDKNAEATTVKANIQTLTKLRKAIHRVVYVVNASDTALARVGFKRADAVYIVAQADVTPAIDQHILDKIRGKRSRILSLPHLVILHPPGTTTIRQTSAWLALTEFALHHHVRLDAIKDMQRLFRFIRGKAVGLVLGGGGTRGWAHLGAIKAMRDAKIPIDIVGGTSVGALVAGFYAMKQSYDDAHDKFSQIVIGSSQSISWRGLTFPIISLFDAKRYTQSQQAIFGEQLIEELSLPYFCITSNMASSVEQVHRDGLLWQKVRASTALPGIMPPMVINGEIHLDGGLLNNLPVDVMRQFVGPKGKVIAVDLNNYLPDRKKYRFPPVLTFKEAILAKWNRATYVFPRLIDLFLRGLFLGSSLRSKQNAMSANIFVSLNLTQFSALHSNPEEGNRLIQMGYDETMNQIRRLQGRD